MAQIKPEYEVIDEFMGMAKKLIDKYPDVYYGIDANLIRCVAIINKNRPDKKDKLWELRGVQMPIRMDCPYAYYVIIHSSDWEEMNEKYKLLLVGQVLCGVAKEKENEGKVNPMDLKDYKLMLSTFGVDYFENPNVPHLLEDNVEWKIR